MELRDTFDVPDIHIIATCHECDKTWDVDFDPCGCECETSQYLEKPEWFVRTVVFDNE